MAVIIKNLSYTYSPKTPYEKKALNNVNFEVNEGDFLGIIGATGSGKSTLIQHLNGLIKLTGGTIRVFGIDLAQKPDLRKLRGMVGMVFQYPEYQLFDETVERDVAFGPRNLGLGEEEISERVRNAVETVGLDFDEIKGRSPFELSGGQKRRVAIAGVIAMRPKILVLDEPTAGLDPAGRKEIYELILSLKRQCAPTVIMVSHNIDEISRYANRIIVMSEGSVAYDLPTRELFKHSERLLELGLDIPLPVKIRNEILKRGVDLGEGIVTPEDLLRAVRRRTGK